MTFKRFPWVRLAMEASNGAGTPLAGVMAAGAEIGEQGIADPAVPPLSQPVARSA
jgi:hypothetical protein